MSAPMKVGFVSLGCPKNVVDAEVMLGLARAAGHEVTTSPADADVLVVNTCAFIDEARQESVNAILDMAELKKSGSCTRLVVTGCLAERYRDTLRNEIPEIDAVLGTGEVPAIVEVLTGVEAPPDAAVPVTLLRTRPAAASPTLDARRLKPDAARPLPTYLYDADTPRLRTTPPHLAYVKVAEGCDYTCAFCIIPALRGPYRSRNAGSIVREAQTLAAQGVREVILISQDTTFYGNDRGERGALARLLRALDRVEGLEWIRLLYLYPTTIGDDTLAAMAECPKVCRYVDLPLQHASDDVLRRMRRPGSRRTYDRLLGRIRERVPGVTLRTTFIVGFPGETDADFDALCDFVRDTEFDHVGVFTYSHEEGTRAWNLRDEVPAAVKRRRRDSVMTLQRTLVEGRQQARVGGVEQVLVDGPAPEHPLVVQGRTEGQAPEIDPVVYLTDCDPSSLAPGAMVRAEVVEARGYDLVARPLP